MNYIKTVAPLKGYRLFLEMEGGSVIILDLSVKLNTMKYQELQKGSLFTAVHTDGNYVIWGDDRIKVTAKELMEIALIG